MYVIEHEGRQFSPDGRARVADVSAHNRAVEAAELDAWRAKPDRFAAYVVERDGKLVVTTWLGTVLSHSYGIRATTHRNNFGARIRSVRFVGTNGAVYYGRYGCDWSQLIRLRRAKHA